MGPRGRGSEGGEGGMGGQNTKYKTRWSCVKTSMCHATMAARKTGKQKTPPAVVLDSTR